MIIKIMLLLFSMSLHAMEIDIEKTETPQELVKRFLPLYEKIYSTAFTSLSEHQQFLDLGENPLSKELLQKNYKEIIDLEDVRILSIYINIMKIHYSLFDINREFYFEWNKFSPLAYASFKGNLEIVNLLLKNGAKLNWQDMWGKNVLYWAIAGRNKEVIKLLLSKGIVPESDHFCINDAELLQFLLEYDEKQNFLQKSYQGPDTPIIALSQCGCLESVKVLVEHAKKLNIKLSLNEPFLEAAYGGSCDVIEYFLSIGMKPNIYVDGHNPIEYASSHGHIDVVKILLASGAEPYFMNQYYSDAETYAAESCYKFKTPEEKNEFKKQMSQLLAEAASKKSYPVCKICKKNVGNRISFDRQNYCRDCADIFTFFANKGFIIMARVTYDNILDHALCALANQENSEHFENIKAFMAHLLKSGLDFNDCPICFEKMNDEKNLIGLRCSHFFHKKCFDGLANKSNCVICRKHI